MHLSSNEEPPIKKRRFTVIDEKIFIPYYAERALKLNKKIKIERVQVKFIDIKLKRKGYLFNKLPKKKNFYV